MHIFSSHSNCRDIAEIAPTAWRGRLVGAFQINIIIGILLAYLLNYMVGLADLGRTEWRWQVGVATGPAALFLLMLLGNPPSARWLALQGRVGEAKDVLRKLGSSQADEDLARILNSLREDVGPKADQLFQRKYRHPIVLAIALAMFTQLVGINAVLYYLNDIFAMAGFDRTLQNRQAVTVGATMLVSTLIALTLIDRFGRRTLLLVGSVGLGVCLAGIAIVFQTHRYSEALLPLVVGYVAFFAFSQGAVIWVYLSEIFPGRMRAQGQSLCCATHWIMNALISGAFPLLAAESRAGPFLLFLVMVVLQFAAVFLLFPETSGSGARGYTAADGYYLMNPSYLVGRVTRDRRSSDRLPTPVVCRVCLHTENCSSAGKRCIAVAYARHATSKSI